MNTAVHQGEPPSYDVVMESEKFADDDKFLVNSRMFSSDSCHNCGTLFAKKPLFAIGTEEDPVESDPTDSETKHILDGDCTARKPCINCDNKLSNVNIAF